MPAMSSKKASLFLFVCLVWTKANKAHRLGLGLNQVNKEARLELYTALYSVIEGTHSKIVMYQGSA